MKIGEKDYTPVYNNRTIWDLEDAFEGVSIDNILKQAANEELNTRQVGTIIYYGIRDHITLDEFIDQMKLSQYKEAGTECGLAIVAAWDIGKKN